MTTGARFAQSVAVRYVAIATLLLAACSSKSADEKLLDAIEPATSWVATLQFASEKWLGNSVPTRFVTAAVGGAQKELDKAEKSVERSQADKELRDKIRAQLEIANGAAGKLKSAVENGDRKVVGVVI